MEHIKNIQDLVGKTIKEIPNEWSNELILKFSDDSFAILLSRTDMDSSCHTGFELKGILTPMDKEAVGLITWGQMQEENREKQLEEARHNLKWIKQQFPELFKK